MATVHGISVLTQQVPGELGSDGSRSPSFSPDPEGLTENFTQDFAPVHHTLPILTQPPAAIVNPAVTALDQQLIDTRTYINQWLDQASRHARAWTDESVDKSLSIEQRNHATLQFRLLNAEARRYMDALTTLNAACQMKDVWRHNYKI